MSTATVRESLELSAGLRLAADITASQRARFLEDILDMLELANIGHRRVSTLGKGELKRLTVGVEVRSFS